MTIPEHSAVEPDRAGANPLLRGAIWVAIGALIAAAIVCVVWVLVGDQNGIVGRAFLTILLLVAFAGVAILDAHLAPRRPAWFALASMASWVVLLLIGAVMIWMPERYFFGGFSRFFQFLVIVLIVQLALLHARLFVKAWQRHVTTFTTIVAYATLAFVIALVVMLVLPLVLSEWVEFADLYWRFVVALAILAAVGTALIPLINALFAPRTPRAARTAAPAYAPAPAPVAAWPTYVDGVTPLPVMPDGSPDWGAYYTGYPSEGAQVVGGPAPAPALSGHPAAPDAAPGYAGPVEPAPAAPHVPDASPGEDYATDQSLQSPPPAPPVSPAGYEGYPPPPPLPPRP